MRITHYLHQEKHIYRVLTAAFALGCLYMCCDDVETLQHGICEASARSIYINSLKFTQFTNTFGVFSHAIVHIACARLTWHIAQVNAGATHSKTLCARTWWAPQPPPKATKLFVEQPRAQTPFFTLC